jgi:hypothetical protein
VTRNGETTDYRAVPVSEEERERLSVLTIGPPRNH